MPYTRDDFSNSDLWRVYDGIVNGGGGSAVDTYRGELASNGPVAASDVAVDLVAANTKRKSFTVFNASDYPLYLRMGIAYADLVNYSVKIDPWGCYENNTFTGFVSGIWDIGADGKAQVTQIYTA